MASSFDHLKPFSISIYGDDSNNASLLLTDNVFIDKCPIFEELQEEGWEGNGYDWQSVAMVVLEEVTPELSNAISFDSEAGMFCAYGKLAAIEQFGVEMKKVYDDDAKIRDYLTRAEID